MPVGSQPTKEVETGTTAPKRDESTCQLWGCQEQRRLEKQVLLDFCCRGHAQLAEARGEWPRPSNRGSSTCSLTGCRRSVYCNPDTGKASEYCSVRHVKVAESRQCVRTTCTRTAFLANSAGSTYCSRACADMEDEFETTISPYYGEVYCGLAGCSEKALRAKHWQSLRFCCEAHRVIFACMGHPSAGPYVSKLIITGSPMSRIELHFLDVGRPDYISLSTQFTSKWLHSKPKRGVKVVDIIKIEVPRAIRERHEDYKTMVPNVRRRFHGTHCSGLCSFYVGGSMCLMPDCGLCNICLHGFKLEENVGNSPARSGRRGWLAFGRGVYFSSVSGKANDFSDLTTRLTADGTNVRCMLVADVAAGKAFLTKENKFPKMERPPLGYDSVVGEVGPKLKYDELVVYEPAAALPTHFVVYRH